MLRAIRRVVPAALVLLAPPLAAQPATPEPHLRFEAPPALQPPRPGAMTGMHDVAEDSAGFLWLATEEGLVRFDGVETRTHRSRSGGLPTKVLLRVAPGPSGRLWVLSQAGHLVRYDPVAERADPVVLPSPVPLPLSLTVTPDSAVWVGTRSGSLLRVEAGSLVARPVPLPGVRPADSLSVHAAVDGAGNLWVAVVGDALMRVDPGTGRARRVAVPGGPLVGTHERLSVHVDGRGRMWVRTVGGLYRHDPTRDRFVRALGADDWPALDEGTPNTLPIGSGDVTWAVDGHDRLWIGSGGRSGIAVLDLRTGTLARYGYRPDAPLSAPPAPTAGFYEDRSGGMWVRALGALRRVAPPSAVFLPLPLPDPALSTRLNLDRTGRLLVSAFCGATHRMRPDGSFERHVAFAPGLALCTMDVKEDAAGHLWVATFALGSPTGLYRLGARPDRYAARPGDPGALPNGQLRVLHEDPAGRLWVGTESGLARYDPATDRFVRVRGTAPGRGGDEFGDETIWAVADAGGGRLWVGTFERGLVLLDPATGEARRFLGGVPTTSVTAVTPSRTHPGTVWVGTYDGGVVRLDADGTSRAFTVADGLPHDYVKAVAEDRRGRVWASTDAGLVRLDPATGAIRTFAEADGLPDLGFTLYAGLALPDGRLAFATPTHLVLFDPDQADLAAPLAPLALTALRVFDAERAVEAAPREVRFAPDDDFFAFEYAALDFAVAARARYRYRLDGFDRDWAEVGPRRAATYTNVPPGRYTLRIEADLGGGWGRSTLAVPVVVEPTWWEVLWVRLAAGLLVLGAVAGGTRRLAGQRLRRQLAALEAERATEQALQAERARISADVHDHVGATLTRIQLLSELIQRSRNGRSTAYTVKIAEAARAATQDLDAIVWAVNPAHDRLDAFADYLCAYAAEFCEAAGLRCRFDRPDAWPEGRLAAEVRYPAFVVVKEALCNAARHARATTIRLRFLSDANVVAVEVEDDGAGFDPAMVDAFSNGLQTMRQRAEAAGARLAVESSLGEGTCVRIALPLRVKSEG